MQALHYTRAQQLPDILAQLIAILDGAMGTMIQRFKLGEGQYRGEGYSGPGSVPSKKRGSTERMECASHSTATPCAARMRSSSVRNCAW